MICSYPMLAGNVAALLSPVVISPILTYALGSQNYDYKTMQSIRQVDNDTTLSSTHPDPDPELTIIPDQPEKTSATLTTHQNQHQPQPDRKSDQEREEEERKLNRAALYSRTLTVAMVLCFLILWPIPMYASSYVFSRQFFTGWVVVGILWLFVTTFGVVVFPLVEGRESIIRVVRMMGADLMGLRGRQRKLAPLVVGGKSTMSADADVVISRERAGDK